jgi:type IV pilus assembly protein PilC
MAKFNYTVQDANGSTASGVLDAPDETGAVATLQKKGLLILAIQADQESAAKRLKTSSGKVSGQDLVFFGAQLSTLLNGGVPLVRSVSMMGENTQNAALAAALQQVTKDVAAGAQFYQALGRHPNVFNNLWVSLIQAGELSGQLPKSLKQIAEYMEAQEEMKGKVLTAMMYPAILFTISMGVLVFFVVKIVPTFSEVFDQFHLTLPPLTLAVVTFSKLLTKHLLSTIIVVFIVVFSAKTYLATEAGSWTKARFIRDAPAVGPFLTNMLIERLLTTMTTLLDSGVSILNALTVLEQIFKDNPIFATALAHVKNDVAQGKAISASFSRTGLLPKIATEMMLMGEESGKLPEILKTLANFYGAQVESFIRRFTSIIDPIMVVFIGGITGVIVLSVFQPIFKLSQLGGH